MSAPDATVETLLRTHAPHAPERLHDRVLATEPARARRRNLPPRRLALVVAPLALGLAVAAALLHGALRSGNTVTHGAAVVTTAEAGQAAAQEGRLRALGPAAVGGTGAGADAAPATPSIASGRLAHTDASLQIRVGSTDELAAATTRATQIATSLGGYADSVDYSTPRGGSGAAYIELRVPAQSVKVAIARLGGLGTIISQRLSVTDLQAKLATESAQIAELRRRVAALRTALRATSLPDAQRVLLQIRLAESKRALAQRLSARKGTISAGANARISLVIGTEKAIAPVAHRGRIDRMLHSAVGFLALEGIVALYALIVVSPFALVGALVWLWRRRSVDRLLAAS